MENNDFLKDLHEFIDAEEQQELGLINDNKTFFITNKQQAGYYIRKFKELTEENNKIKETAEEERNKVVSKINAWEENLLNSNNKKIEYFKNLLEIFAQSELEGQKTKLLKLPFGTLQFKKQQNKYNYKDDVLLSFIQSQKELEKYLKHIEKTTIDKAKLKKSGVIKNNKLYINDIEIKGIDIETKKDNFIIK
nr:MAG: hypothetical protein B6I27_01950 [Erwiniaceae bacterium 4572_131]